MTAIQIRPAVLEDLVPLRKLMFSYIVDFYKSKKPESDKVEELIQHLLDHHTDGKQFVAETEDGTLAGFATLYYSFSTTRVKKIAILNDLFVDSSFRGAGLGEELFQYVLAYTKKEGFAYMSWQTAADNKPAQALYSKMGGKNINHEWIHYEIEHN
ncbi:GNAT family N-acetyltransferase [Fictibacillus barbaricus]|uniref:GNAT superfamily N-acetyltransferase n=1 Tax=Fictibacillus barbaricus TaxID=182136 RepID=A0ABU1U232_9BACL|nr:GNAT family N-acetyltransferase [Fictibacillus barbaricus]MDR7073534.1 GNAT superfamily N-acetyltransferase [Fictibacillus barbaricus]